MYFQINVQKDRTRNITHDEENLNKCDFVLVTDDDFNSNNDCSEDYFVRKTRNWLCKTYPKGDWFYKKSKSSNHVFWKNKSFLEQRQLELPFNQAA